MAFLDYTGLSTFWENIKFLLAGKQNMVSFGNGIKVEGDTVSIAEPIKGITKVEYDALSEEEKMSGFYIITDASVNLSNYVSTYSADMPGPVALSEDPFLETQTTNSSSIAVLSSSEPTNLSVKYAPASASSVSVRFSPASASSTKLDL